MNPERFSTRLALPFTHRRTNPKKKHPSLVMSPEILNPESKGGTLNPNTFESGKFCRVNVNVLRLDFSGIQLHQKFLP